MSGLGKRFITEKDAEVRRQAQQAEGVVEEPYDARSLYDRLQIEKNRKQEEFESQIALKNRIHRLDKEEVDYLKTLVDKKNRTDVENEKEVAALMREVKVYNARPIVSHTGTRSSDATTSKPASSTGPPTPSRPNLNSQRALLAKVVKRPSDSNEVMLQSKAKRPNISADESNSETANAMDQSEPTTVPTNPTESTTKEPANVVAVDAIPGLVYSDSDQSDQSTDDSDSDSTDVEDAACTLHEVATTRLRKAKCSDD